MKLVGLVVVGCAAVLAAEGRAASDGSTPEWGERVRVPHVTAHASMR